MEENLRLFLSYGTPSVGFNYGFIRTITERYLVGHENDPNNGMVTLSLFDSYSLNCICKCELKPVESQVPELVKERCTYSMEVEVLGPLGDHAKKRFFVYALRCLRDKSCEGVCMKLEADKENSSDFSFYISLGFENIATVNKEGVVVNSSLWKFSPEGLNTSNTPHDNSYIYMASSLTIGENSSSATTWNPASKICYNKVESYFSNLDISIMNHPLFCTAPEPWKEVETYFNDAVAKGAMGNFENHDIKSMDLVHLQSIAEKYSSMRSPITCVIGVGGGSACDTAKYMSYHMNIPLILIPSILSVDAPFTRAAGVRVTEGAKTSVKYVGDCSQRLQTILLDKELLGAAPLFLNVSGVGDLLSIITALWDWKYAAEYRAETFNPYIAEQVAGTVTKLFLGKNAIRDFNGSNSKGMNLLAECFAEEVLLCEKYGNARPEEGSEHYLAYALESSTGRGYIHGKLIGLCTVIVSLIQACVSDMLISGDNDVDSMLHRIGAPTNDNELHVAFLQHMKAIAKPALEVAEFLTYIELDCSFGPSNDNPTQEEVRAALLTLPSFLSEEKQLLPGVFHMFANISPYCLKPKLIDAVLHAAHELLSLKK